MKAVLFASAVAAMVSGVSAALSINTPGSLTECQPILLQWSGGTAPYFLSVYNAGAPTVSAENLGQQNGTSFTWTVDIASGQSVGFDLTDSTGLTAQSSAVPIQAGTSTSCVGTDSTASGSGVSPTGTVSSGSSGSSSSAAGGSTTASATSPSSTKSSPSTSGSASSSSTSATSGAFSQAAQLGVVGIFAVAIAGLLA